MRERSLSKQNKKLRISKKSAAKVELDYLNKKYQAWYGK